MDRIVDVVAHAAGGSVGDLFDALFELFTDYTSELSKPLANFIKDLVVKCYTANRLSYEMVDWATFAQRFSDHATKSHLYLALHAIPPQFVSAELVGIIARGLESTPFHEETIKLLAA